jgi:hypothetical protein
MTPTFQIFLRYSITGLMVNDIRIFYSVSPKTLRHSVLKQAALYVITNTSMFTTFSAFKLSFSKSSQIQINL